MIKELKMFINKGDYHKKIKKNIKKFSKAKKKKRINEKVILCSSN